MRYLIKLLVGQEKSILSRSFSNQISHEDFKKTVNL